MSARRLHAYILMLLVVLIWGIATPVIKFTLGGIDPLPFLTYRFAISTVIMLFTFKPKYLKFFKSPQVLSLIFFHGLLAVPVALIALFTGLDNSTVLDSSLITIIAPLTISLMGVVFLREHISKREKLGTFIAVLGTTVVILWPIFMSSGSLKLTGNLFLFIYLISDSFAVVLLKKLVRHNVPALLISNTAFTIGLLVTLPIFLVSSHSDLSVFTNLSLPYHAGVWYMALLSGTVAYALRSQAQKTIEISKASVFGYLLPLVSTPLAVFWLGEQITPHFIIGAIIIAIGVYIAETKAG